MNKMQKEDTFSKNTEAFAECGSWLAQRTVTSSLLKALQPFCRQLHEITHSAAHVNTHETGPAEIVRKKKE